MLCAPPPACPVVPRGADATGVACEKITAVAPSTTSWASVIVAALAVLFRFTLMASVNEFEAVGLLLLLQPSAHSPASITATRACLSQIGRASCRERV